MKYNTQQRKLPLPEYGRSIQNLVDYALTIEDRAERQHCANSIINIMGGMFTHLRDVPDFKHKLWDHLAIMADFNLDIDYPYEIIKKDKLNTKPDPLPYPKNGIRYRHYGRMLEKLIKKTAEYPEGEEKQQLIGLVANHMKKSFIAWNKDTIEDRKIFDDLSSYTNGAIQLNEETTRLTDPRTANSNNNSNNPMRRIARPANNNNNNNNGHNNGYNNNNNNGYRKRN